MKHKTTFMAALLLFAAVASMAQQRIKAINITVTMPKVNASVIDGTQVTGITTDVSGAENMLADDKISAGDVGFFEIDTQGERTQPGVDDKFEAGREYVMVVNVTNYTDVLFNYKNDKEFTVDDSMVKATLNNQPAKITMGSGRPLTCEMVIKMPGQRDARLANTKVSAADGNHSGQGYVDLGLPSGTLWGTCNVGATKPEGYGQFFAYGEAKTKTAFKRTNYAGYNAAETADPAAVSTGMGLRLTPKHDPARQNWGGEWATPTRLQCYELRENCNAKYMVVNGVKGTLYTSMKNGKSIFIPYQGTMSGEVVRERGVSANYMTANGRDASGVFVFCWGSANFKDKNTGLSLFEQYTYMHNEDPTGDMAHIGYPVRAVWGGKVMDKDKEKASGTNTEGTDEKKSSKKGMKGLLSKGKGLLNILK